MPDFTGFKRTDLPFAHWVNPDFLSAKEVRKVNDTWPAKSDPRWFHEDRQWTRKSAIMFPQRLHPAAQVLAGKLYSPESLGRISDMVGIKVSADPWFVDGPDMPRVGGGLHEIHSGGLLKMHVDFSHHPAGFTRALNFLIYLNEEWRDEWGGALRLGDDGVEIYPRGGTAVVFETTGESWHGHPEPLTCPPERARRSLALYYYRPMTGPVERVTTVYRQTKA